MDKTEKAANEQINTFVEANQHASAKNEAIGEGEIKGYDEVNPQHKAYEDIDEIQSTDDV